MANRKPTQAATLKTNGNKKIDRYLIREYNHHSFVAPLVGINDLPQADARRSDKPNAFVLPSKAPPNKQQVSPSSADAAACQCAPPPIKVPLPARQGTFPGGIPQETAISCVHVDFKTCTPPL
ncbi:hypothetical protein [Limnohabitans sp. T6-20]|uniref:hypothetical protein n=1 Tax=Limnohabitans sp. T6-20 TaxID=1100725 RepID=UPI0011B217C8|nr:hypothetical protein [Limnohabitans sp. T6-20]